MDEKGSTVVNHTFFRKRDYRMDAKPILKVTTTKMTLTLRTPVIGQLVVTITI